MTDIVARLREIAGLSGDNECLALEAADEIERLRGACKDKADLLKDAYAQIDRLREFNTRLCTEIERQRAALESLTKDPPATLDEPDTDAEVIIKMRAIAQAALDEASIG